MNISYKTLPSRLSLPQPLILMDDEPILPSLPGYVEELILKYILYFDQPNHLHYKLRMDLVCWNWFRVVSKWADNELTVRLTMNTNTIYWYTQHIIMEPCCVWKNIRNIEVQRFIPDHLNTELFTNLYVGDNCKEIDESVVDMLVNHLETFKFTPFSMYSIGDYLRKSPLTSILQARRTHPIRLSLCVSNLAIPSVIRILTNYSNIFQLEQLDMRKGYTFQENDTELLHNILQGQPVSSISINAYSPYTQSETIEFLTSILDGDVLTKSLESLTLVQSYPKNRNDSQSIPFDLTWLSPYFDCLKRLDLSDVTSASFLTSMVPFLILIPLDYLRLHTGPLIPLPDTDPQPLIDLFKGLRSSHLVLSTSTIATEFQPPHYATSPPPSTTNMILIDMRENQSIKRITLEDVNTCSYMLNVLKNRGPSNLDILELGLDETCCVSSVSSLLDSPTLTASTIIFKRTPEIRQTSPYGTPSHTDSSFKWIATNSMINHLHLSPFLCDIIPIIFNELSTRAAHHIPPLQTLTIDTFNYDEHNLIESLLSGEGYPDITDLYFIDAKVIGTQHTLFLSNK